MSEARVALGGLVLLADRLLARGRIRRRTVLLRRVSQLVCEQGIAGRSAGSWRARTHHDVLADRERRCVAPGRHGSGDRPAVDARTRDVLPSGARDVSGNTRIDGLAVAELGLDLVHRLRLGVTRRRLRHTAADLLDQRALARLRLPRSAGTSFVGCL